MKRLLVLVLVAAAVLLALRRPAPSPAIAMAPPEKSATAQHSHPSTRLRTGSGQSSPVNASAVVYVVGAVAHAGLYRVPAGARVNDAIARAGGLRADADRAAINLAERVADGEEIRVLRTGENAPPAQRKKRKSLSVTAPPAALLDLNAADATALASIPGIGPTLASRIVEYRRLNGPFASLDELADVAGMTQRRIDAMSAYVTVGS
jgi:competence protein ComEA